MLVAKKSFKNFKEASNSFFKSDSLAQSDLGRFLSDDVTDLDSMEEKIFEIYEELKHDKDDRTNYPDINENGFSYSTYSGINMAELVEVRDQNGEVKGYLCEYAVYSEKPIEYSSAMRTFRDEGWICEDIGRTLEEQEKFRIEYENELIEDIREYRKIPDVDFSISFLDEEPAYITSHYISNDPYIIQTLLKNRPEITDEIIEVINEQIKQIDEIIVPTTYDFNESVHMDSNFYIEKKDEIKQTLTSIRDELLRKKLESKETELSILKNEEQTITAAEQLIDKQSNSKEVGE